MSAQPVNALTLAEAARIMREALRRHSFLWMYAIQAGEDGPIKLGVTRKPSDRLATLQVGNAAELRGLAAWRILPLEEKQIHDEYAYARIRGEWFRPVPELVEFVLLAGREFEDWA
jgi:hypothetical protein